MATLARTLRQAPLAAALGLIKLYQYFLSPWVGHHCRFYPSCSHYTATALKTDGLIKGAYLGARRVLRCHPWHSGGIDQ